MTGDFGSILFIALRSSRVTSRGVTGTSGVKGWYGVYGTPPAVHGVFKPADNGVVRSKTVVLVDGAKEGDESPGGGSKARNGSCPVAFEAVLFSTGGRLAAEPGIIRFGGREVAIERLLEGGRILRVDICSAIERVGETGDGSFAVFTVEALREWLIYG